MFAIALLAVPAVAQTQLQNKQELAGVVDNPCTAEFEQIEFDVTVQTHQQVWKMPNGDYRLLLEEDLALDGKYQSGQAAYTSGTALSDIEYINQPVTTYSYRKMNTPDEFHLVTVKHFDPATLEVKVWFETACGNGMPDSKE